MEPLLPAEGEFHHFQLVNSEGEVPLSITLFVHLNPKYAQQIMQKEENELPIGPEDVLAFHEALETFDGDFITALSK